MSDQPHLCWYCNKPIPQARLDFLLETNVLPHDMACVDHSQTKRIQGIYLGEAGTSEIKLCKKVYNDSVRSKFHTIDEGECVDDEEID